MTRKPFHQNDYERGDKRVKGAAVYAFLYYRFGGIIDIRNRANTHIKRTRLI